MRIRYPHIISTKDYRKIICQVWQLQIRDRRPELLKRSCSRKESVTDVGEVESVQVIKICTLRSWPRSKCEMNRPLKFTTREMIALNKKSSLDQHAPRVRATRWKRNSMGLSRYDS
jgi:hypothetical protein